MVNTTTGTPLVPAKLPAEVPENPAHESNSKSGGNKIRESNQNAVHSTLPLHFPQDTWNVERQRPSGKLRTKRRNPEQ
jgi:hypothetical protein